MKFRGKRGSMEERRWRNGYEDFVIKYGRRRDEKRG